ncbi:MAG: hypothetical protein WCH62_00590, partial [Candidatus Omnitrophota bacterium]
SVKGKIIRQDKNSIQVDVGLQTPFTYFLEEIKQILPDRPHHEKTKGTSRNHQADQLEKKAVELIDENKMDEGMALMKQAVVLDSSPMRHMNYGSILFGNGVEDYKSKNQEQALKTLSEAQQELRAAIEGFNPKKEGIFLAQAYFLLGEIYLNAYSDRIRAKEYYQKAVFYYDNQSAKAALEKLQ